MAHTLRLTDQPLAAPLEIAPARPSAYGESEAFPSGRLEAMRRHLVAARPASGNEALRLLRAAFPHVPLAERVRAAEEVRPAGF